MLAEKAETRMQYTHEVEQEADDLGAAIKAGRDDVAESPISTWEGHTTAPQDVLVLREPPRVPSPHIPLRENAEHHRRAREILAGQVGQVGDYLLHRGIDTDRHVARVLHNDGGIEVVKSDFRPQAVL